MAEPFVSLNAIALPLMRSNVDTDAIIPSREMKRASKTGLGEGLFANWRYIKDRQINPEFVLNQPEYDKVQILLALKNFGCGSSREHAVWALREYGFRVLIAPSFGEIFYGNCIQNGLLPIRLDAKGIGILSKPGHVLKIDLSAQTVDEFSFEIAKQHKRMLLEGLDAIDLTQARLSTIQAFEEKDRRTRPWVYL